MGCLMRKQTINSGSEAVSRSAGVWLDLERLAQVEITSESAEHPIESRADTRSRAGLAGGATRKTDDPPHL